MDTERYEAMMLDGDTELSRLLLLVRAARATAPQAQGSTNSTANMDRPLEMLLVEDDPGDVRLMVEAVRRSKSEVNLSVVQDGMEALEFLRREGEHANAPPPDLVLLDLNLPRMDGRELLGVMKQDAALQHLPVIVLTTSEREEDVRTCYQSHANCYITKPATLPEFLRVVSRINTFWGGLVRLPN